MNDAGFVDVTLPRDSDRRWVRTVSPNVWVSALHRLTGFGWWEWETAVCSHNPDTCVVVRGDHREALADISEPDLAAWLEKHRHEKNSMETLLDAMRNTKGKTE